MEHEHQPLESDQARKALLSILEDEKLAKEELQKSEERLRLSTELANVAVWEFDFATNSMSRSKNHDYLYGLEFQAKWEFNNFLNATHPDDRKYLNATIQKTVAVGGPDNYKFDFRVIYPDQSVHWLMVTGQVTERNADGLGVLVRGVLIDITERKRAELGLQESEAKFSTTFLNSPIAMVIMSTDGKFTEVNQSFCELIGYSREEIIGKNITDYGIISSQDREKLVAEIEAAGGSVRNADVKFHIRDGSVRDILYSVDTINIQGVPHRLSTCIDITERKRAEEAVRESEQRFLTFMNSTSVFAWMKDEDLKYVFLNKAFEDQHGITLKDVQGKDDFAIRNEQIAEILQSNDRKVLSSGEILTTEEIVEDRFGQLKHSMVYKFPVLGLSGKRYIGGMSIDITERKLDEEEIKKTNEELLTLNRVIYHSSGLLGIKEILDNVLAEALNISGLEGGTICLIEPDDTLKLICQRETSEATIRDLEENKIKVGDCLCGNCAHDNCPLILYNRQDVLNYATREALRGEDIRFHAAFPLTSKEKCVGVLCVFTRTDKKPEDRSLKLLETMSVQVALAIENAKLVSGLEQQVEDRTSQLKDANKELESFSYSISHDLRAPLRAIYGFSQILSDRHRASLNDEGKQYMDYVVAASIRMEQLINDLLSYSRLGRTSLAIRPVSLKAILDTVFPDFQTELNEIGGELAIISELPTIQGDETLLRQIFSNLIGNAIKYRRTDVALRITISGVPSSDGYLIKITDNGIGIPKEHWGKIFNVFQRLHGEDKYSGTGIGLATVKKCVHILGGSIGVESIVGEGSAFLLHLPNNTIKAL